MRQEAIAQASVARSAATVERSLLIVDDDAPFRQRLAQAMERRGYAVATAETVAGGVEAAGSLRPAFAVVDLRLGDGNGLEVVPALRPARPDARILVLTGPGHLPPTVAPVQPQPPSPPSH